jgi:DNA primase
VIPDETVDRVRDEADIVAIIGEFVKLKRVGNSFRGPCPFHHGKNNNFSVSLKGGYKCFVCQEAGDVFTFVQKHLGLDFTEAVKWVGARVGVEVREVSRKTEERDAREPLWEVNGTAAEFFRGQLWEAPLGKQARDYLASRGITREDADRFGIGYAPRDVSAMRTALQTLGFDDDRQIAAGLLVVREERPEPRPRFRDRLMFPIYDASNRVVGFGGRILGDGEPKYLNSAESDVFSKRKLLYGLNWAKQAVRKADRLIVVEGYFDAIRLMIAGVTEVVAPLGTALTEQQAALIRKYTKNVFLLYDSDAAGLKATFRAGDELLANGIGVRVISLPEGEDPDTFVAKVGAEGFEKAAAASVDVFDRKIQILERGGWFADLRRKREAVDKLLTTIRVVSDRLLRDLYIARTSEVSGISREILLADLRQSSERRPAPDEPPASAPQDRRAAGHDRRHAAQIPRSVLTERELVRILLYDRSLIERAMETIDATDFRVLEYRRIYTELVNADPDADLNDLATRLDEESAAVMGNLSELNRQDFIEKDRVHEVFSGVISQLRADALAREREQIELEFASASEDEKDDLLRRKTVLQRQGALVGRVRWNQFRSKNT